MDTGLRHGCELARDAFDRLHAIGNDGRGITRPSYSAAEDQAHALVERIASEHGLLVRRDWAGNLYVTLPGRDRNLPAVMTGSHLDSVPCGGNFDGAAGVLAAVAVLTGWARTGFVPDRDVTLIVTRAEESAWFPVSYIGSKAAFGLLTDADLAARRVDDDESLAEHIRAAGGNPDRKDGPGLLNPAQIDSFVELHIEQGPVLEGTNLPVGLVTGICGSVRYRSIVITGRAAHSGATPRAFRSDAAIAAARLMVALDDLWGHLDATGEVMTLTFGVCRTDASANFSAVAGQVEMSLDMRSRDIALLQRVESDVRRIAAEIADRHGVAVDLGARTSSMPAVMDPALLGQTEELAKSAGLPFCQLPSGAGHDAATFAGQGVPALMIFVRNANGSHNPDESMDFADFAVATGLLEKLLRLRSEGRRA